MSAGLASSGVSERESEGISTPLSKLLVAHGIPWLVDASLQSLPPSLHGVTSCVCLCPQPNLMGPHLSLITSAKTLIPNKVTLTGIRGWDLDTSFWETHFNPHRCVTPTPTTLKVSDNLWL